MSEPGQEIVAFFLQMQRNMKLADAEAVRGMFAAESLEANPAGTRMRRQDEVFQAAIEERLAFLLLAGMRDVKALAIDSTPLGAGYELVRVRWSVWFQPPGRPDFVDEFVFDYLVHRNGDRIEIAASIAHDDDRDILRRIQLSP